eukprot:1135405-Lingulodinium_polyedra.AAC.1
MAGRVAHRARVLKSPNRRGLSWIRVAALIGDELRVRAARATEVGYESLPGGGGAGGRQRRTRRCGIH